MSICGKVFKFFVRGALFAFKRIWVFFAGLLFVQLGLLYISVSEIRVPGSVVSHVLEALEKEGLSCSVGDVYLENLTVITVRDFEATLPRSHDPLLRVRHCSVKLAPSGLISGNMIPDFVFVEGADFFCPAVNSATGESELLFSDGSLNAQRFGAGIKISTAKCCLGSGKFVTYGKIPRIKDFLQNSILKDSPELPSGMESSEVSGLETSETSLSREKLSSILSQVAGKCSAVIRENDLRALLSKCTVEALLDSAGSVLNVSVQTFFDGIEISEDITLKNVFAEQKLSVDPDGIKVLPTSPLRIFAQSAGFAVGETFSEKVSGSLSGLQLAVRLPDAAFAPDSSLEERLPSCVYVGIDKLNANNFLYGGASVSNLLLAVEPLREWTRPGYRILGNVSWEETPIAWLSEIQGDKKENLAVKVFFDTTFHPFVLGKIPQLRDITRQADFKALRFAEKPNVRGNVELAPGLEFKKASFGVSSGEMSFDGLMLRAVKVAGTLTPDAVHLSKMWALGPDFDASGDFYTEFKDHGKFRVRAWGSVDPKYIDGRLPWFWDRIWRDLCLDPSGARPQADFDVRWTWGDPWEHVFGAISAEKCYANGILVDKATLRVCEAARRIAAFDIGVRLGDYFAEGCLQWNYAPSYEPHFQDFRFRFEGTAMPDDVLQIVGEGLPQVLEDLKTEGPASAVVVGYLQGDAGPESLRVNIDADVPGDFSAFGMAGKNFKGEITFDHGIVYVPFTAEAGHGRIGGKVRVVFPEEFSVIGAKVELDLTLNDVRRSSLAEMLEAVGTRTLEKAEIVLDDDAAESEGDVPAEEIAEADIPAPEDLSSVDAVFAGTLVLPDLASLDAEGSFLLLDENLFELQALGGISRLLSTVGIDLMTYRLTTAESSFVIRNGTIFVPDLRVWSDSGEILVQANVSLPDLNLTGEAVFRNLRGTQIPLLGLFVKWGSASTTLLPIELSGTVTEPDWKFIPRLSRIWDSPEPKFGIAPEAYEPLEEFDDEEEEEK